MLKCRGSFQMSQRKSGRGHWASRLHSLNPLENLVLPMFLHSFFQSIDSLIITSSMGEKTKISSKPVLYVILMLWHLLEIILIKE